MAIENLDYGVETVIPLQWGGAIRTPAWPEDCSYVRITNAEGAEIGYWNSDEWKEAPEEVMGAFIGQANSGIDFGHGK